MVTTDRVQVSEALDSKLLATGIGFDDAHNGLSGSGTMPTEGIDPSSVAAAAQSHEQTNELIKRGKSATEKGRNLARDGKDEDSKSAKDVDSVDDVADKDLKGGRPQTETSADAAQPGGPGTQANGAAGSPMSGMPSQGLPQMGMPSYNPASLPSVPMASQFDMNNAPNRDALRTAARDGARDGSLPGSRPGHHNVDTGAGDTEFQKRFLAAVDASLNAQPPISYAWGGGHGGTPGPSQGIRDGGWADQCGDFNKVGVDCSGYYRWMFYEATGRDLASGSSESLYAAGTPVSDPQPGDAAFPGDAGRPPSHIQIYIGNGQVAEAQKSGTFLLTSNVRPGTEFRRFT